MTLSPKTSFLQNKDAVTSHARAVESMATTRAAEVALLQFTMSLSAADGSQAAANAFKIEGARRVLDVLLSLHEPVAQPKAPPSNNLNFR